MKCPNCANEIPEGRKACGYCGVKIVSAELFLCPNCSEELPSKVKVCGYCGTKIEKPPVIEKKVPKPTPVKPKKANPVSQKPGNQKKPPRQKPLKAKQTTQIASKSELVKKVKKTKITEKKPADKTRLPNWLGPVLTGVVVVALALVYFFILRPSTHVETDLHAKTSNKQESYTLVYWDCDPMIVSTTDDLDIYYYWLAKEEVQIDDFISNVEHSITINGESYKILKESFGDLEDDPEGVKRRVSLYIGTLPPGEYTIETSQSMSEPVFDGSDWFGPGTDYPGFTQICQLTVE